MTLILTAAQVSAIGRHGSRDYPGECCGFLAGEEENGRKRAVRLWPVENGEKGDRGRSRFFIDPCAVWENLERARTEGLRLVGVYHSHPDRPPVPSGDDSRLAWHSLSCLIMEIQGGEPSGMRSWTPGVESRGFEEEELVVER